MLQEVQKTPAEQIQALEDKLAPINITPAGLVTLLQMRETCVLDAAYTNLEFKNPADAAAAHGYIRGKLAMLDTLLKLINVN